MYGDAEHMSYMGYCTMKYKDVLDHRDPDECGRSGKISNLLPLYHSPPHIPTGRAGGAVRDSPPIPPCKLARSEGEFKDRLEWFFRNNQFLRFGRFISLAILE